MEDELVKEQPVYEIQKVKLKNNQVTADYTERFVEANYKNEVTKSSQQFVHPDLLYAMSLLKTHAVKICEMQESRSCKYRKSFRMMSERETEKYRCHGV